jgi:serine/threonine protein kinase
MSKDENRPRQNNDLTERTLIENEKTMAETGRQRLLNRDERTVVNKKKYIDDEKTILERPNTYDDDLTERQTKKQTFVSEDKTITEKTITERTITETTTTERTTTEKTITQDRTVREKEETFRDTTLTKFKEWDVIKEFPAEGGEADIYLLRSGKEYRVLKLYRRGMEPKPEVLKKIKELTDSLTDHVIKLYEYGKDPSTGRWYELLEFAKYGNLKQFLRKVELKKPLLKKIIYEVNEGLKALHDANIIHRDLKPSNLLIRSVKPLDIAFSDFGISSIIDEDKSKKMTTVKGTPIYSAPEAFTGVMGKSADYWSLGMIILDLVDRNPLKGLNMQNIMYQLTVKNVPIPEYLDEDIKILLKGLLTRNPSKRWGYEQVKKWLYGVRDIPVYYENEVDKDVIKKPYKFADKDYFSLKDIAEAFLEKYENFELAEKHIARGEIIKWLEANGDLDTATKLENIIYEYDLPDEMVVRFAYEYADGPFRLYGIKITPVEIVKILQKYLKGQKLSKGEKRLLNNIDKLPHLYIIATKANKKLYNPRLHDFLENLAKFVDIKRPSTIKNFLKWFKYSIEFLRNKDAIKPTDFVSVFQAVDTFPEELPKGILTHTDIDKLKKYKKDYYVPRIIFDKDWDTKLYNQVIDFIKDMPDNLLPIKDLQEVIMDYILPAEFDTIEDLPLDEYLKVVEYFQKNKNRFIPVQKYEELIKNYILPEELKHRSWSIDQYERILSFLYEQEDKLIPKSKLSERDIPIKITINNYEDVREAQNLIFDAAKRGNKQDVELALKMGASINQKDKQGNTPLHIAAKEGHFEVVKYLVEQGANINELNNNKDTPLSLAFPLHYKIVRYLLKRGGKGLKRTLQQLLVVAGVGALIFGALYFVWKPLGIMFLIPYSLILILVALALGELLLLNKKLALVFILGLLILIGGLIFLLTNQLVGIFASILGGIIVSGSIIYLILKGSE